MRLVMPIFPRGPEEEQTLRQGLVEDGFLARSLGRLADLNDIPALVFGDAPELRPLAERAGAGFVPLPRPEANEKERKNEQGLPFGTRLALAHGLERLGWSADEACLVLDYRAPLLNAELIRGALDERLKTPERILASAHGAVDHPAQIDRYYRVLGFEALTLRDPAPELSPPVQGFISRELYFDWPTMGLFKPAPPGLFALRWQDRRTYLEHLPQDAEDRASEPGAYARVDEKVARRVWRNAPDQLAGLSCYAPFDQAPALLTRTEAGYAFYLNKEYAQHYDLARVWALSAEGDALRDCCDLYPMDLPAEPLPLPGLPARFCGPLPVFQPDFQLDESDATLILAFLRIAVDGGFDVMEPLDLDQRLWSIDADRIHRVNLAKGVQILGRQDFPEVFHRDGALSIGSCAQLLAETPAPPLAFPIPCEAAVKVESLLDALRYKAVVKAQSNALPSAAAPTGSATGVAPQLPQLPQLPPSPSSPTVKRGQAAAPETPALQDELERLAADRERALRSYQRHFPVVHHIDTLLRPKTWLQTERPMLWDSLRFPSERIRELERELDRLKTEREALLLPHAIKRARARLQAGDSPNAFQDALDAARAALDLAPLDKDARALFFLAADARCADLARAGDAAAAWSLLRERLLLQGAEQETPEVAERLISAPAAEREELERFRRRTLRPLGQRAYQGEAPPKRLFRYDEDQDGRLFLSDNGLGCVHVLDREGAEIRRFGEAGAAPGQFKGMTSVLALDERVLVAELGNNRIQALSKEGAPLGLVLGPGPERSFLGGNLVLERAPDGGFFVLETRASSVHRFDANLNFLNSCFAGVRFVPGLSTRLGFMVWSEARGRLLVSDLDGRIHLFDERGEQCGELKVPGPGAARRAVDALAVRGRDILLYEQASGGLIKFREGLGAQYLPARDFLPDAPGATLLMKQSGRGTLLFATPEASFYEFSYE